MSVCLLGQEEIMIVSSTTGNKHLLAQVERHTGSYYILIRC